MNQTNYLSVKIENFSLPVVSVKQGEINFDLEEFENKIEEITNVINEQQLNINNVEEFYNLRAKLNKFAKNINDEKIKIKKEYNQIYTLFENKVVKCRNLIEEASEHIDDELKKFEEQQKQILREEYQELWKKFGKDNFIPYERIENLFGSKWFLKSCSKKKVLLEMTEINDSINKAIEVLKLTIDDEKEFNLVLRNYYNSLDLTHELGEYTKWKNTISQQIIEKEVIVEKVVEVEKPTKAVEIIENKFEEENKKIESNGKVINALFSINAEESVIDFIENLLKENNIKYQVRRNICG